MYKMEIIIDRTKEVISYTNEMDVLVDRLMEHIIEGHVEENNDLTHVAMLEWKNGAFVLEWPDDCDMTLTRDKRIFLQYKYGLQSLAEYNNRQQITNIPFPVMFALLECIRSSLGAKNVYITGGPGDEGPIDVYMK